MSESKSDYFFYKVKDEFSIVDHTIISYFFINYKDNRSTKIMLVHEKSKNEINRAFIEVRPLIKPIKFEESSFEKEIESDEFLNAYKTADFMITGNIEGRLI